MNAVLFVLPCSSSSFSSSSSFHCERACMSFIMSDRGVIPIVVSIPELFFIKFFSSLHSMVYLSLKQKKRKRVKAVCHLLLGLCHFCPLIWLFATLSLVSQFTHYCLKVDLHSAIKFIPCLGSLKLCMAHKYHIHNRHGFVVQPLSCALRLPFFKCVCVMCYVLPNFFKAWKAQLSKLVL